MKFKRIAVILIVLLLSMTLFACNGNPPSGNGNGNGNGIEVPILDDLPDYSSNVAYYQVTPVEYGNIDQQIAKLEGRQEEILEDEEYDELSVPVKIFVNADADEIIRRMGQAALSKEKMTAIVDYMAGEERADDLDSIVATGKWVNNPDWSFFDDWDYLEKLKDRADESNSTDNDEDNVQRQKRKIMKKIYSIGMTGDEFGRFIIQELSYAIEVSHLMHNDYPMDVEYDEYVKRDLSFDALVYFKAFNQFRQSQSQTVQLYGYYYDYNKASHEAMDDETFEKHLKYSHQKIFTHTEFKEYVNIQRENYIKAYRYQYSFYKKFYTVHFKFQGYLEDYDLEVYDISTAFSDTQLKYSREMSRAMDSGFGQQLILMDHLYRYSADEARLIEYNTASREYEQVRDSGTTAQSTKDEKKMALQYQQLKIVDYILNNMNNTQLSNVLRYHILSYSGDMLRNIQSEKKTSVLEQFEIDKYIELPAGEIEYKDEIEEHQITIGRTNAIVAQLINSYAEADPQNQYNIAPQSPWEGIRVEVKATLDHDYSQYSDGTKRLEAFEDLLIKKKMKNRDGTDWIEGQGDDPTGVYATEEYDTSHNISRFLNSHDEVMRYSVGQVKIELKDRPNKNPNTQTTYSYKTPGSYTLGNDGKGRTPDLNPAHLPNNYPYKIDEIVIAAGSVLEEGLEDVESSVQKFLIANREKVVIEEERSTPGMAQRIRYTYEFEGWYIDVELKYQVREDEKVRYDLILYPGYSVVVEMVQ